MSIKRISLIAAVLLAASTLTFGKLTLPSLFGDNMVLQRDAFVKVWGFSEPGRDISIKVQWQSETIKTVCSDDGSWMSLVKTPSDKGPYVISISDGVDNLQLNDVLAGEVWLCSGQSNMGFGLRSCDTAETDVPKADYPEIRFFGVNRRLADVPQQDCEGNWLVCQPDVAAWYSGVAYYFARKVRLEEDVPIGIIQAAVGGTPADSWISRDVLLSDPQTVCSVERYDSLMKSYDTRYKDYQDKLSKWEEVKDNPQPKPRVPMGPEHFQRPYALWNGMINPLLNYRIAGVLWYQGEGNSWRADQYRKMFPMLIESWRESFRQGDFPFYYVQIAPYDYGTPLIAAELREAQQEALSLANTAMVCTMDIGDNKDIHPKNKKDVGERLATIALNRVYHVVNGNDSGPMYAGKDIKDGSIRIYFDNADSGLLLNEPAEYFEIAGDDGVYYKAVGEVDGNTLILRSDEVDNPVNVRYGWSNTAGADLFNKDGLPAYPFRTNNTVWVTKDKLTYF